MKYNILFSNTT